MSTIVVTPPAAAARVADANPSHSVRPGSLTCTWVSTSPGSSTSSSASSTVSAAVEAGVEAGHRDDPPGPDADRARATSAPPTTARRARTTRSRSVIGEPAPRGRSARRSAPGGGRAARTPPRGTTPRPPARGPSRIPASASVWSSSRHWPATATTGTPARRAAAATPAGALPRRVCSSSDPSPVTTRSAPASASSSPVSSWTTSAPVRSLAPSTATAPNARPPAAPAPGRSRSSLPVVAATTSAQRGQGRVELRDQLGSGALLRAVDRGRARGHRSAGCRRRRPP